MVLVENYCTFSCLELFMDLLISFVRGIDLFFGFEFFFVFFIFPVASGRFVLDLKLFLENWSS